MAQANFSRFSSRSSSATNTSQNFGVMQAFLCMFIRFSLLRVGCSKLQRFRNGSKQQRPENSQLANGRKIPTLKTVALHCSHLRWTTASAYRKCEHGSLIECLLWADVATLSVELSGREAHYGAIIRSRRAIAMASVRLRAQSFRRMFSK